MDKIIKKVGSKKSAFRISAATGLVMLVCGVVFLLASIAMEIGAYMIVVSAILIVCGIPFVLRTYNIGRCSVCVCEDKLFGTSGNANFYKSFQFEIDYNEIVSLNEKSGLFLIEKRDMTLYLYIEEAEEVKKLIEQQMAKKR